MISSLVNKFASSSSSSSKKRSKSSPATPNSSSTQQQLQQQPGSAATTTTTVSFSRSRKSPISFFKYRKNHSSQINTRILKQQGVNFAVDPTVADVKPTPTTPTKLLNTMNYSSFKFSNNSPSATATATATTAAAATVKPPTPMATTPTTPTIIQPPQNVTASPMKFEHINNHNGHNGGGIQYCSYHQNHHNNHNHHNHHHQPQNPILNQQQHLNNNFSTYENNYENENLPAQSIFGGGGSCSSSSPSSSHYQNGSPVLNGAHNSQNGYHSNHQTTSAAKPMEVELEKICLKQHQPSPNHMNAAQLQQQLHLQLQQQQLQQEQQQKLMQQKQPSMAASRAVESAARFADEPEYRMEHPRRGYAIIINNKYFDSKLDMPTREGTDRDAFALENSLRNLGFDTKLFNNCTATTMRDLLAKYAKTEHWDSDCFVCVLLSHGENGVIFAVDKELELDSLIHPFKFNRSLAGKPKLFFIQACRGSQYMEGIDASPFAVEHVSKIPMEADFLVAYSTVAGYYSWRNSQTGSWFIQSLCHLLDEYADKLEIMQLLTAVNRRVAFYYESNTDDPTLRGKKQVPCIVSMLTKELYFRPKKNASSYSAHPISISYD